MSIRSQQAEDFERVSLRARRERRTETVALKDALDFAAAGARLQRFAQIDLVGFAVVFTCMILMRFGY